MIIRFERLTYKDIPLGKIFTTEEPEGHSLVVSIWLKTERITDENLVNHNAINLETGSSYHFHEHDMVHYWPNSELFLRK